MITSVSYIVKPFVPKNISEDPPEDSTFSKIKQFILHFFTLDCFFDAEQPKFLANQKNRKVILISALAITTCLGIIGLLAARRHVVLPPAALPSSTNYLVPLCLSIPSLAVGVYAKTLHNQVTELKIKNASLKNKITHLKITKSSICAAKISHCLEKLTPRYFFK